MQNGGNGCISATANVNPARIKALFENWESGDAVKLQAELDGVRGVVAKRPMIAALKATIGSYSDDPAWRTLRPPLAALGEAETKALRTDLDALGFTMPGVAAKAEPATA